MDQQIKLAITYTCSPNIALVKYWGKYNQQYILPLNDSLGVTLHQEDISTKTTIKFSKSISHYFILNNQIWPISKRILKILAKIKQIAKIRKYPQIDQQQWKQYNFQIQSVNSFPTASGLASSASGLACLAASLNGLFGNILSQSQLSSLARLGSGSASRSLFGGLVQWKGIPLQYLNVDIPSQQQLSQLSDLCVSKSIYKAQDIGFMSVLILLANNSQKEVSSTSGMQQSVKTSSLIKNRNKIARQRIQKIKSCNQKQSEYQIFSQIAETIIKDSNQFHAICLDTYPPIFYLNEFSKQIMHIVDHILNPKLKVKIAYTFDAGPHAFIFLHRDYLTEIFGYFHNQLNQKARNMKIEHNSFQQYQCYKGDIIRPYALWVTQPGVGAVEL